MSRPSLALLGCSIYGFRAADACTSIAIGRKATADGSVIVSQSEDGDNLADPRVLYVPARDFPEGAMAPSYYTDGPFPRWVSKDMGPGYAPNALTGPNMTEPIGYIPQVRHTFAYWAGNFATINEHNVAIQESTCSAAFYTCAKGDPRHCEPGRTAGEAITDSRMLTHWALERATTAREAVRIMGDLAYKYGFYGTHDSNGDGESLIVGDKNEAWVFHILADPTGTKAIWAAVRVPDDSVTVVANMFTLRAIDVSDTANCMASANIYSVAEAYGWWKPGEVLDFTRIYGNGEYGTKYYSGRRMWRIMALAAPSLNLNPEYNDLRYDRAWPWAAKVDQPVTLQNVFSWYRDWYGGTPFDMTKGLAAGYGGTPDRFKTPPAQMIGGWERTIALYRTNLIKVAHLQAESKELPRAMAGVAWVATGPGHYSPFLPLPSGFGLDLPTITQATPWHFNKKTLYWQARKVMTAAQVRFDHMHPLVERQQHHAEAAAVELLNKVRLELLQGEDPWEQFQAHAERVTEIWSDLPDEMLIRFNFNADMTKISANTERTGKSPTMDIAALSYPDEWLRQVGYTEFPMPPMETACPPLCPAGLF